MRVYKFTNEKYYSRGSFRLGTLYDYRNKELYGERIGDKNEGFYRIDYDYSPNFSVSDEQINKLLENQTFSTCWVRGNSPNNDNNFLAFTPSNTLVFSATLIYNESLFEEFVVSH